jgi:hypothetical protein
VNVSKAYFGLDGKASKPTTQAAQSVSPAEIEAPGELPFEQ